MGKIKGWTKIRDRKLGRNISIIYQNGNHTLELFKDAMWGNATNMNVILRG